MGISCLKNGEILILQGEAKRQVEGEDDPDSSIADSLEKEGEDEDKAVHCCCQQIFDDNSPMVHCDTCHEWYHYDCVSISHEQVKRTKKYTCPICTTLKGHYKDLNSAANRCHRTLWVSNPSPSPFLNLCPSIFNTLNSKAQSVFIGVQFRSIISYHSVALRKTTQKKDGWICWSLQDFSNHAAEWIASLFRLKR